MLIAPHLDLVGALDFRRVSLACLLIFLQSISSVAIVSRLSGNRPFSILSSTNLFSSLGVHTHNVKQGEVSARLTLTNLLNSPFASPPPVGQFNNSVVFSDPDNLALTSVAVGDFDPRHSGNELAVTDSGSTTGARVWEVYQQSDDLWTNQLLFTAPINHGARASVHIANVDPTLPGQQLIIVTDQGYMYEVLWNGAAWTYNEIFRDPYHIFNLDRIAIGDFDAFNDGLPSDPFGPVNDVVVTSKPTPGAGYPSGGLSEVSWSYGTWGSTSPFPCTYTSYQGIGGLAVGKVDPSHSVDEVLWSPQMDPDPRFGSLIMIERSTADPQPPNPWSCTTLVKTGPGLAFFGGNGVTVGNFDPRFAGNQIVVSGGDTVTEVFENNTSWQPMTIHCCGTTYGNAVIGDFDPAHSGTEVAVGSTKSLEEVHIQTTGTVVIQDIWSGRHWAGNTDANDLALGDFDAKHDGSELAALNGSELVEVYHTIVPQKSLTVNTDCGGTNCPVTIPGQGYYPMGQNATLTAPGTSCVPSTPCNRVFSHWIIDGSSGFTNATISVKMNGDHVAKAVYLSKDDWTKFFDGMIPVTHSLSTPTAIASDVDEALQGVESVDLDQPVPYATLAALEGLPVVGEGLHWTLGLDQLRRIVSNSTMAENEKTRQITKIIAEELIWATCYTALTVETGGALAFFGANGVCTYFSSYTVKFLDESGLLEGFHQALVSFINGALSLVWHAFETASDWLHRLYANVLDFRIGSDATVLIKDPQGRRLGTVSRGQVMDEIPNAVYSGLDTHPQLFTIANPLPNNYRIEVANHADGVVHFASYLFQNSNLVPGTGSQYSVSLAKGNYVFQIDPSNRNPPTCISGCGVTNWLLYLMLTAGIAFAGVIIAFAVWRLPNRLRKAMTVAQQPGPASFER